MSKIIAVDFDGTIVSHAYPDIGQDNPRAIKVLKKLLNEGHRLILWTVRSGDTLQDAINYCNEKGITFWAINENPEQNWSNSNKQYAHLYIDDAALGCPVNYDPRTQRHWVNWTAVEGALIRSGYLSS